MNREQAIAAILTAHSNTLLHHPEERKARFRAHVECVLDSYMGSTVAGVGANTPGGLDTTIPTVGALDEASSATVAPDTVETIDSVPTTLLPCPFCGSDDIDPEFWSSVDRKGPGCNACNATAESIQNWNKRVKEQ